MRSLYRCVVTGAVVLCHLLTAGLLHVPAAAAMNTPTPAMAAHCHDHAQAGVPGPTDTEEHLLADTAEHLAMSAKPAIRPALTHQTQKGHTAHHCSAGACTCTCAHAPAALPLGPSDFVEVSRLPPISIYRLPRAAQPTTPFFRPPI